MSPEEFRDTLRRKKSCQTRRTKEMRIPTNTISRNAAIVRVFSNILVRCNAGIRKKHENKSGDIEIGGQSLHSKRP